MGEGRADLRTLLREEVMTRRFQSARALGMIRGNIELAAKLAAALETMSPMLDATKKAWCEADAELGSGADHTAIIRWLERLEPPKTPSSTESLENVADA
jgi:3-hydroxyisobutyrate dehydrogenase-like beta-hydroxyacid dehydrogenase